MSRVVDSNHPATRGPPIGGAGVCRNDVGAVVLAMLWACGLPGCSTEQAPAEVDAAPSIAVACVPGQVEACACRTGIVGTTTCVPSGVSLGPCECPRSDERSSDGGAVSNESQKTASPLPTASANPKQADEPNEPIEDKPKEPIAPPPPPDARARDVQITEVAIYQVVKIPLVKDGEPIVERNAPVVAGKQALLRTFVKPLPGFTPRELEAELTLRTAESAAQPILVRHRISSESKEGDLDSTINFYVPGTDITEDVSWSVTLRELDPLAAVGTIDDGARYPVNDGQLEALRPRNAGPLRVMVVPYRYNADGSGRVPDVSDEQLQRYRAYLSAYYPFSEVVFEVHEPVDYERAIEPSAGWEDFLDLHCELRASESPDPKLFYYGVIDPTLTALEYDDGMVGLSNIPGPAANRGRCAVGLGFSGGQSAFIMSHELGHALGLPHAPCGASGGPYPYDGAKIGSWGFLFSSRKLMAPDEHYDLMSYCSPVFISDFNYQKLFERLRYLNLQFAFQLKSGGSQAYLRILQHSNGQRALAGREHFAQPPGGDAERREVHVFDGRGELIESKQGAYFIPMSQEGAGTWFIPDVGGSSVEFRGVEWHGAGRMAL